MPHMLKHLRKKWQRWGGKWKIHETDHRKPLDKKNAVSKTKNTQDDIYSKLNTTEEVFSEFEDTAFKNYSKEKNANRNNGMNKNKMKKKNAQSISGL